MQETQETKTEVLPNDPVWDKVTGMHKNSLANLNKRGRTPGVKNKKTILVDATSTLEKITDINQLREKVLNVFLHHLNDGSNRNFQLLAAKEVAKYLFATQTNIQGNIDYNISVKIDLGIDDTQEVPYTDVKL